MITKATKEDSSRLLEIWESAVLATHDFLTNEDFEFYKAQMPNYLNNAEIFKFLNDKNIILAFLAVDDSNIDMLFVDAEARGNGIGSILIKYAIDELNATKVDVNEQNTKAFEFYKHKGFKLISRQEKDDMNKPYPILHLSL